MILTLTSYLECDEILDRKKSSSVNNEKINEFWTSVKISESLMEYDISETTKLFLTIIMLVAC